MKAQMLDVFITPSLKGQSYPMVEIPPATADEYLGDKSKCRVVISFANGVGLHRAIQRNKDGYSFITLGKSTLKEAGVEPGTHQKMSLKPDKSKYGMPMPEEFEEVLRQDPEGREYFDKLTPGAKRSYLYYVGTAKTVDTRINRSLDLVEKLKNGTTWSP